MGRRPKERGGYDPVAAAEAEVATAEVDWAGMFGLYPEQEDFVLGSSRFYQGWVAGRGTGKSFVVGGVKALICCIRNPGRAGPLGRTQKCPGAVFARTMDEARDPLGEYFDDALSRFEEVTGIGLLSSFRASTDTRTLVNGASMRLRSWGRDDTLKKSGRSPTYAWAGMDEVMFGDVDSQRAVMTVTGAIRHPLAQEPQLYWATSPDGYRGIVAHSMQGWASGDPDFYLTTATVFDNPYVDDRYRRTLKAGCTPRQWLAEGLGKVLRPLRVVYSEYDERKHVKPWVWDPTLPWVLIVDWGETYGYVGAVQIVTVENYRNPSGTELPCGSWIVAREWPMVDGNRPTQRRSIERAIRELGYPRDAAADRAIPEENDWLEGAVGPSCPVHIIHSTDVMRRSWGIGAVQWMFEPPSGVPLLYVADSLNDAMDPRLGTMRASLQGYQYRQHRLDNGELVTGSKPEENSPASHACDALRYGISCTLWDDDLHGGRISPYLEAHPIREDTDAGLQLKRARLAAKRDRLRRRRR